MQILLETRLGAITIEVFDTKAPRTAAYFLGLIDRGGYDGTSFYRSTNLGVADGPRLIQGGPLGGILADSIAKPANVELGGSAFSLEEIETTSRTGLQHRAGTVSLARDLIDTGFALPEIFICLGDFPQLDFGGRSQPDDQGFPAFGEVVDGLDIAAEIADRETTGKTRVEMLEGQILASPVTIARAIRANPPSGD